MNNIRELFIKNLKYLRKQKGINQLTLSTEIGKGVNYISNIETGIVFPPPETIDEIAEVLKNRFITTFCRRFFTSKCD